MIEHTVSAYDEDLNRLTVDVARLGRLAIDQVHNANNAIAELDEAKALEVVRADAQLDILEAEIEQSAARTIALRQPMAIDLRQILAAMKIASNLERCGDLAKSIAKRAVLIAAEERVPDVVGSIHRMGELVVARLRQVLEADAANDLDKATLVWRRDQEVDEIYSSLFRELLTYMMADPKAITPCAHMLYVAKNLERVGDHATNIAEILNYRITGEPTPGSDRPKWDSLTAPS
ncbi:MAG: phosphate signaling complex protein PhoU [Alphaproteobacteria bacterium]|nr:phosphate signaling complex protein PhoU [Alphaproteobacteria bacterium]